MKKDNGHPMIGNSSTTLGVRTPGASGASRRIDIEPDLHGNVHPGTGGLSVASSIGSLVERMPDSMIPERLQVTGIARDATGSNILCIWSTGQDAFVDGPIGPSLQLVIDPLDPTHGYIEPNTVMSLDKYINALNATQGLWVIDEDPST